MDSKIAFPFWAGYSIWPCSPRRSILGLSLFLNLKRLDCCGLNLRAHSLADFLLGFKERSEIISHNSCVLAEPKSLQDSSFCYLPLLCDACPSWISFHFLEKVSSAEAARQRKEKQILNICKMFIHSFGQSV